MRLAPLSAVAEIAMGSAPPSASYNETGQGVPMISGAGDFRDLYPAPKKWTTDITRLVTKGDLIVCVRATIGDLNWADRDYCLGRGVAGVRAKPEKADIRYIARVLEAKKSELSRLGTGSTFLAIRKSDLEGFKIPLPPLDEQKRIAAVLDKADVLRHQRQESLHLTDNLLHSVFIDMVGSETAPRCPRVRLSNHLDFITSGGRGWAQYHSQEGDKFIRSMNVQMNEINDSQMIRVTPPNNAEADRTRVRAGDVLLTITGSLIGRVAPVTGAHAGAFVSQHVAILRTHGFRPEFLSWAMSTKEGQHQIQMNQTGQTKPGLNFEQIGRLTIPRPSEELEETFSNLIKKRQNILSQQRSAFECTNNFFSSLQQRAFCGELDLSRIVLDLHDEAPHIRDQEKPVTKAPMAKAAALFRQIPHSTQAALKKLDSLVSERKSISWSADYFKYRILGSQPSVFSFSEVMRKAESVFDESPPYEEIKDMILELLGYGESPALLRQRFDLHIDEETKVVSGRKEIVFERLA
jgi:type I restriction enzyme S subunit